METHPDGTGAALTLVCRRFLSYLDAIDRACWDCTADARLAFGVAEGDGAVDPRGVSDITAGQAREDMGAVQEALHLLDLDDMTVALGCLDPSTDRPLTADEVGALRRLLLPGRGRSEAAGPVGESAT